MKNFKLLLATTAILSTGALMANAGLDNIKNYTNSGFQIPVEVTLIEYIRYDVEQGLNFGKIGLEEADDVELNKTIAISAADGTISGDLQYFGGAKRASIFVDFSATADAKIDTVKLSFAKEENNENANQITLHNSESNEICGTVDLTQSVGENTDGEKRIYVGGTFSPSAIYTYSSTGTKCVGSVTATFIVD